MSGAQQRRERGVAAEQRVHPVEGDGVVAVVGAGLEDRRQVEQRRAEVGQVVEPLADPVERAAVELGARRPPAVDHGVVPVGRRRPVGGRQPGRGALEPVGEHLVADLVGDPVRHPVLGADPEVVGVGDVAPVHARAVEPARVRPALGEQEAVRRQGVVHVEVGHPPGPCVVLALPLGLDEHRLAVADRAQHDVVHDRLLRDVGNPYPDGDAPSEHGWFGAVERGPVVVRVPRPRHDGSPVRVSRCRGVRRQPRIASLVSASK